MGIGRCGEVGEDGRFALPTFHIHDCAIRHFLAVGLFSTFLPLLIGRFIRYYDNSDATVAVELPQFSPLRRWIYVRLYEAISKPRYICVPTIEAAVVVPDENDVKQNSLNYRFVPTRFRQFT